MYNKVVFLDYDGVINIEPGTFNGYFDNPEAIRYLNKFCLEFKYNIVVTSSWRRHPEYQNFLYDSGLNRDIHIIGCTSVTNKGREFEIYSYLEENPEIEEYIIIDDAFLPGELCRHLVQTSYSKGFNRNKYIEAVAKIDALYNNKNVSE